MAEQGLPRSRPEGEGASRQELSRTDPRDRRAADDLRQDLAGTATGGLDSKGPAVGRDLSGGGRTNEGFLPGGGGGGKGGAAGIGGAGSAGGAAGLARDTYGASLGEAMRSFESDADPGRGGDNEQDAEMRRHARAEEEADAGDGLDDQTRAQSDLRGMNETDAL